MDRQFPLVSIITACLNSESTIQKTIESVLAQTYQNIEYIIIDGGSKDRTVNIISKYRNRICHFISEPDRGVSDAFNKGILLSHGEYIQILNADDYLPQNAIELAMVMLQQHPDMGFVFGDIIRIDPESGKEKRILGDHNYQKRIHFTMPRINHPTNFVKKSLYDVYGLYSLRWKLAMDYDWLLRVHKNGVRGYYSGEIVTYMTGNGRSDRNALKAFKEVRNISVCHGFNLLLAYSYFVLRCFKHVLLKSIGLR